MANRKITDLPEATSLDVADLIVVVTGIGTTPTTKKITKANFFADAGVADGQQLFDDSHNLFLDAGERKLYGSGVNWIDFTSVVGDFPHFPEGLSATVGSFAGSAIHIGDADGTYYISSDGVVSFSGGSISAWTFDGDYFSNGAGIISAAQVNSTNFADPSGSHLFYWDGSAGTWYVGDLGYENIQAAIGTFSAGEITFGGEGTGTRARIFNGGTDNGQLLQLADEYGRSTSISSTGNITFQPNGGGFQWFVGSNIGISSDYSTFAISNVYGAGLIVGNDGSLTAPAFYGDGSGLTGVGAGSFDLYIYPQSSTVYIYGVWCSPYSTTYVGTITSKYDLMNWLRTNGGYGAGLGGIPIVEVIGGTESQVSYPALYGGGGDPAGNAYSGGLNFYYFGASGTSGDLYLPTMDVVMESFDFVGDVYLSVR